MGKFREFWIVEQPNNPTQANKLIAFKEQPMAEMISSAWNIYHVIEISALELERERSRKIFEAAKVVDSFGEALIFQEYSSCSPTVKAIIENLRDALAEYEKGRGV